MSRYQAVVEVELGSIKRIHIYVLPITYMARIFRYVPQEITLPREISREIDACCKLARYIARLIVRRGNNIIRTL